MEIVNINIKQILRLLKIYSMQNHMAKNLFLLVQRWLKLRGA